MTFKELVAIFQAAQTNSLTLKSFYLNELWEIGQADNILYPALYLEQTMLCTYANAQETYSIAFDVVDRSYEDLTERVNVLSRCKQIGESILRYLVDNSYTSFSRLTYTCTPFQEQQKDRVWGWRFEIQIQTKHIIECIQPFT